MSIIAEKELQAGENTLKNGNSSQGEWSNKAHDRNHGVLLLQKGQTYEKELFSVKNKTEKQITELPKESCK